MTSDYFHSTMVVPRVLLHLFWFSGDRDEFQDNSGGLFIDIDVSNDRANGVDSVSISVSEESL